MSLKWELIKIIEAGAMTLFADLFQSVLIDLIKKIFGLEQLPEIGVFLLMAATMLFLMVAFVAINRLLPGGKFRGRGENASVLSMAGMFSVLWIVKIVFPECSVFGGQINFLLKISLASVPFAIGLGIHQLQPNRESGRYQIMTLFLVLAGLSAMIWFGLMEEMLVEFVESVLLNASANVSFLAVWFAFILLVSGCLFWIVGEFQKLQRDDPAHPSLIFSFLGVLSFFSFLQIIWPECGPNFPPVCDQSISILSASFPLMVGVVGTSVVSSGKFYNNQRANFVYTHVHDLISNRLAGAGRVYEHEVYSMFMEFRHIFPLTIDQNIVRFKMRWFVDEERGLGNIVRLDQNESGEWFITQ